VTKSHLFRAITIFLLLLDQAIADMTPITVSIDHDDGGKTSQSHLASFFDALQASACHAIAYEISNQPAQLLFDPAPHTHALKSHPDYELIAIAKTLNGDTDIRGAIIVQASTGITELDSLKGSWFSFISKNSWAGYLLPLKLLNKINIDEKNSHFYFVGNHIGSAAALNHGDVQAAIIAEPLARRWADHNQWSIVAVTEAVETGGWWIHKSVSSNVKLQCTRALTQLTKSQHKVMPVWIDGFEINLGN